MISHFSINTISLFVFTFLLPSCLATVPSTTPLSTFLPPHEMPLQPPLPFESPDVLYPSPLELDRLITPMPRLHQFPVLEASPEAPTDCIRCLRNRLVCPASCSQPKKCLPNWWICNGLRKPRGYSNTCCGGWRCVRPIRPGFGSKRCEPNLRCIPNWWHCNSRTRCCGGWRCVRPRNRGFLGRRCEPLARKCVPNWWHCRKPKNKLGTSRCCGGWRCVLHRSQGFNGHRCEP